MKTLIAIYGILLVTGGFLNIGHAAEQIPGAEAKPSSYFYTGKPYDKDLGEYTFAHRDYDPGINRWTTVDPDGFPDGANNRIYAPNPTSAIDPTGCDLKLVSQPDFSVLNTGWSYSAAYNTAIGYFQDRTCIEYTSLGTDQTLQPLVGQNGQPLTATASETTTSGYQAGITFGGTYQNVTVSGNFSRSWGSGSGGATTQTQAAITGATLVAEVAYGVMTVYVQSEYLVKNADGTYSPAGDPGSAAYGWISESTLGDGETFNEGLGIAFYE